MTQRNKTQAERSLEREAALQRQELLLSGALKNGPKISAAQLPNEIPRSKPNKVFMAVGVGILVFLVFALISSIRSAPGKPTVQKPVATEKTEE